MLKRRPLVKFLLSERPKNLLAVSGLGSSTWDVTAAGDDARNFCFIGAMGQAARDRITAAYHPGAEASALARVLERLREKTSS